MKLGVLFRDGMVLQSGKPIRVFGEAKGDVTVTLDGETKSVSAKDGKWLVELDARAYGGPYEMTVSGDGETIHISDIMIGEVLLCAGQSNIQFAMGGEVTPREQYVTDPLLRIYTCDSMEFHDVLIPNGTHTSADGWVKTAVDNIDKLSAIGYLVGLDVRRKKDCAVGVLVCSQGASAIPGWIPESCFVGKDAPLQVHKTPEVFPTWKAWEPAGSLYHAMLEPMIPYTVSSVIWYQGESNAANEEWKGYLRTLELLVESWRAAYMDVALPFCIVQVADYIKLDEQEAEGLRMVQQQQMEAGEKIPGVVTVRSADVSENDDQHPRTKYKLAKRISDALY